MTKVFIVSVFWISSSSVLQKKTGSVSLSTQITTQVFADMKVAVCLHKSGGICSAIRPSSLHSPGTVLVSLAITATGVLVRAPLTVSQLLHQLVVLVAQYPREEERGLVRAAGFKSSPWPTFAVDWNVPLALHASSPSAAAAPRWQRLFRGMMAGCIGVVSQFVNSLHKLTFFIEHFLVGWEWSRQRPLFIVKLVKVFFDWRRNTFALSHLSWALINTETIEWAGNITSFNLNLPL